VYPFQDTRAFLFTQILTLETANTIYGITMGGDGAGKVIGLRLDGNKNRAQRRQ
jgi:hypothetical protein